jgi:hypothetical protein
MNKVLLNWIELNWIELKVHFVSFALVSDNKTIFLFACRLVRILFCSETCGLLSLTVSKPDMIIVNTFIQMFLKNTHTHTRAHTHTYTHTHIHTKGGRGREKTRAFVDKTRRTQNAVSCFLSGSTGLYTICIVYGDELFTPVLKMPEQLTRTHACVLTAVP